MFGGNNPGPGPMEGHDHHGHHDHNGQHDHNYSSQYHPGYNSNDYYYPAKKYELSHCEQHHTNEVRHCRLHCIDILSKCIASCPFFDMQCTYSCYHRKKSKILIISPGNSGQICHFTVKFLHVMLPSFNPHLFRPAGASWCPARVFLSEHTMW